MYYQEKFCAACHRKLVPLKYEGRRDWDTRKYCNQKCRALFSAQQHGTDLRWKQEEKGCKFCQKMFGPRRREGLPQWRNRRFCTSECRGKWSIGPNNPNWKEIVARQCLKCGKDLFTNGKINRHDAESRKFCDNSCRVGELNSSWRGGRYTVKSGYVYVHVGPRKLPRREHVLVAEAALGRSLRKGEVVHHINGIKTDNRNRNLLICTVAYHSWLHARMSELYMQEHFPCAPIAIAA